MRFSYSSFDGGPKRGASEVRKNHAYRPQPVTAIHGNAPVDSLIRAANKMIPEWKDVTEDMFLTWVDEEGAYPLALEAIATKWKAGKKEAWTREVTRVICVAAVLDAQPELRDRYVDEKHLKGGQRTKPIGSSTYARDQAILENWRKKETFGAGKRNPDGTPVIGDGLRAISTMKDAARKDDRMGTSLARVVPVGVPEALGTTMGDGVQYTYGYAVADGLEASGIKHHSIQCFTVSPPYYHMVSYTDIDGKGTPDPRERGHEDTVDAYVSHIVDDMESTLEYATESATWWIQIDESYEPKCGGSMGVIPALQAEAREAGFIECAVIIWADSNPMDRNGSHTSSPRRDHEYILVFSRSSKRKITAGRVRMDGGKNMGLGSVWTVTHQTALTFGGKNKGGHPTPWPVTIPRNMIEFGSDVGELVCDYYAGSGMTGVSAIEKGRKAVLIELNSHYLIEAQARCEEATRDDDVIVAPVTVGSLAAAREDTRKHNVAAFAASLSTPMEPIVDAVEVVVVPVEPTVKDKPVEDKPVVQVPVKPVVEDKPVTAFPAPHPVYVAVLSHLSDEPVTISRLIKLGVSTDKALLERMIAALVSEGKAYRVPGQGPAKWTT